MARLTRTTIDYPFELHEALRIRAKAARTTMSSLVGSAVSAGLLDPDGLGLDSVQYNRRREGVRSTFRMTSKVSDQLQGLAAKHETSLRALILAAIHRAYPDL